MILAVIVWYLIRTMDGIRSAWKKSKTAEKRIYCINGILWQILEVVFGSLKFIQLKVLRFQNRADFNKSSGIHLRKNMDKKEYFANNGDIFAKYYKVL